MPKNARRRTALVGIDGFAPAFMDQFLDAETMPALAALRARGCEVPLLSTIPACTPVAWAAMMTGCHPQTNDIQGFLTARPGQPLDCRVPGVFADRLKAEPIWQTALLNGLRSYVVKFPVSYPSQASLRVDGAAGWGGITCLHETAVASTSRWPGPGQIGEGPAWAGAPPGGGAVTFFGRLCLPNIWGHRAVEFSLAILDRDTHPVLAIASAPDWSQLCTMLEIAQWSEPIVLPVEGRTGREDHALRFKLMSLEAAPTRIALFNTCVHALFSHSAPWEIWQRHLAAAGPIEEQTDPSLLFSGAIDIATQIERCRLNVEWLCKVSRSILTAEPWDFFAVQLHFVDWAHHLLHGALDPRHPRFDRARHREAHDLLRLFYAMADELVGEVTDAAGDADIIVTGDHGQDLHHTTVRLNEWLAERGLIRFIAGGEAVDWAGTSVCALGNTLHINRSRTIPGGIVSEQEAEYLIEWLCCEIAALIVPETGEHPIQSICPRQQLAHLGGAGEGMGDVVFFCASGYQARNDRGPLFQVTEPWREFTSGHDHFSPLDPRLYSRLYAAGPHVASRAAQAPLHSVIDVAPTIAALLGIAPSPDTEGHVIDELLAAIDPTNNLAEKHAVHA
ncbi:MULTISPECIES: alkaline phosphatase family protein [Mesorhizobium]|uniref:Type I phosphodiesterase / nucleotide pyrophosphatase n=1 Tax=Mesorhizobium qingshengii TaxID=1165689 RepID=A0A1G5ZWW6_9HYPH|nr:MULTISPECIES: alkaline phosphatase family protein [Mesorhizobium]MCH4560996.1 alkaline phosphatase family protein [Mesorhizobium jarvisii]SDA99278.1 Type I phosphodiesterase / nucleotide pyrophosphatase [Mesorhizobium qingshengii]